MTILKLLFIPCCLGLIAVAIFINESSNIAANPHFHHSVSNSQAPSSRGLRIATNHYDQYQPKSKLRHYDQAGIEMLYFSMSKVTIMLLVFDGNSFKAFTLGNEKSLSFRYVTAIPLMVHALKTTLPERFKPGQPHFQMVFTTSDLLFTPCVNKGVDCPHTKNFPPLVSFSTVHRDETILPTAKSFPNPHYTTCLYQLKLFGAETCQWQEVDKSLEWEGLTPTILWRGSDFLVFLLTYDSYKHVTSSWIRNEFSPEKMQSMSEKQVIDKLFDNWNQLTPRWRATALTLKAKLGNNENNSPPWIDAMFTGDQERILHDTFARHGLPVADDMPMDSKAMSRARYQIDLGGGGGTTWQGTLTKLQMPGVLFHHETPTKDWFYDRMEPWVHYIPVGTGLDDLYKQYKWAEEHQEEAKKISKAASKLAEELLSLENMEKTYEDLFVAYLSEVVEAYQPLEQSWQECVARYERNGIGVHEIADCSGYRCHQEYAPNTFFDFY